MLFTSLPNSQHEWVVIRPLEAADLTAWFHYLSMPKVHEHTSWNVQSPSELEPYVWTAQPHTASTPVRFALGLRATGQLVGTAGFHTVSAQNRTAELAYDLSPTVWGKGIATHICQQLTAWAHEHVGLVRVQATTLETNARSAQVLLRCGYQHEGLLRSYRVVRGRPGNFNMYGHVVDQPLVQR